MFLKNNSDVIPLRYYTATASNGVIGGSSNGASYTNGGIAGRLFTASGNLVIQTGGAFQVLLVGVGRRGLAGVSAESYGNTGDGNGGGGGDVQIIYCTLNAGTYTVTLPTVQDTGFEFTPTTTVNTVTYPAGTGGAGDFGDFTGVGMVQMGVLVHPYHFRSMPSVSVEEEEEEEDQITVGRL